ncbi:mitochondrial K+-H+ exchange-related-domain-containing protein [Powellomyces hirtus]|nr:mitochondrial K+-H+ exchange-related-domain-containing protein [Powellomyces hirtus]
MQLSPSSVFNPRPAPTDTNPASEKEKAPTDPQLIIPYWTNKGVAWSTTKWDEMGKKEEGSFTRRLHVWGEKLKDLVDSDEWFLKSIPGVTEIDWKKVSLIPPTPSTIPSSESESEPSSSQSSSTPPPSSQQQQQLFKLPIHHASSTSSAHVSEYLHNMLSKRKHYHQRHLTLSLCFVPFSCLFMVLPGPNVPLAWNLFRLYSHWRALQGVHTLKRLESADSFLFVPDTVVDHHLRHWEIGHEKEEYIPADVVEGLVKGSTVGEDFAKEVGRKVIQIKKRRDKQGVILGTLNKEI